MIYEGGKCEITVLTPWNEATGAMSHVESPRRIREPLGGNDSDQGGNSSLQSKLDLSFVCIPWCKRYGKNVP